MILYFLKNGLKAHTYTLRAQVLAEFFKIENSGLIKSLYEMDCEVQVGYLYKQLFINYPSFIEKSLCESCGDAKLTEITSPLIQDEKLGSTDFKNIINELRIDCSDCLSCNSESVVEHTLISVGMYHFFKCVIIN